jgi:PAS domain S-box-containing protein
VILKPRSRQLKYTISKKITSLSLLSRMLIVSSLMLSIIMGIIFVSVLHDESEEARIRLSVIVSTDLNTIPSMIGELIVSKKYASLQSTFDGCVKKSEVKYIAFKSVDGISITSSSNSLGHKNFPDIFADILSLHDISGQTSVIVGGINYGTLEITVSATPAGNNIWYRFVKGSFLFILIMLLNAFAMWQALRHRLLPSLRALEEATTVLSNSNTHIELKENGAPELRKTLAAFNKMASTIRHDRETIKNALSVQQTLIENNAAGFLLVSSNRTMLIVNKQFCEMFGYTQEEVVGKDVRMVHVSDESYSAWAPQFQVVKDGMTITNVEYRLLHKSGRILWFSLYGSKIDLSNGKKGVLWSMTDITERKAAEAELKQLNLNLETKIQDETAMRTEQERILMQQSRMAAMGEMIGAIAHQWRQPLNTLGIMIQELKYTQKDGELTPEALEVMITKSMNVIKFMSKTIDDFRGFFKADKTVTEIVVIERVKHSVSLLSAQLNSNGVELHIQGDERICISCLANEFDQIILNIVNNAKDVLIEKNIQEPEINVKVEATNNGVKILISDNGGGIPGHIIDKIFDPYFTTKGPDKGTGMGLYMSKIIAENHMGGTLQVKNSEHGALFCIEIPTVV